MEDEKKEKKGYTFTDKRGLDKDDPPAGAGTGKIGETPGDNAQVDMEGYDGTLPAIDFTTLIMSFASAAIVNMGRVPDPLTNTIQKNMAVAKQNIDIISLLQEKSRGNLTSDEEKLIEQVLYELRMSYIISLKEEK